MQMSEKIMRVLVTGSRLFTDRRRLDKVFHAFTKQFRSQGVDSFVLVHGDCRGCDRLAENVVLGIQGWSVEKHPADWSRHGRRAGWIRNTEMLDSGIDYVLAFPVGESRGTRMTISLAKKRGIPVKVFEG